MNVFKVALAILFFSIAAFYIYYVAIAPDKRVYPEVLSMHSNTAQMPHWKRQLPFLYVSWFYHNRPESGRDYALYDSGIFLSHRITSRGREGGGSLMQDSLAFHALKQITSLPPGLPSPDAIPHGYLLIVSLCQGKNWKTYYYDRRSLPLPVQPIAQAVGVEES